MLTGIMNVMMGGQIRPLCPFARDHARCRFEGLYRIDL